MIQQHTFFMCDLDGALASIFVDLSLLERAPDPGRPALLGLRIALRAPHPNGLSTDAEFDALRAIEDAWTRSIAALDALVAGRSTSAGHRELYAYAPSGDGYVEATAGLVQRFPDYDLRSVVMPDPDWRQYRGVLCPDESGVQQIQNREMVMALEQSGDSLTTPRPVTHYAYFPGAISRDAYIQRAAHLGFILAEDGRSSTDGATMPFGAELERTHAVDFDSLTSMTGLLRDLATSLRGEYDGCVTKVVGPDAAVA
jgi:Family of unknown function (DUF695)/Regulator of ribonuclease activity B